MFRTLLVLIAIVGLAATSLAECIDYGDHLHRRHLVTYPDYFFYDAARTGDLLVAGTHTPGLVTVAMPGDLPGEVLDLLPLPDAVRYLAVAGDLVFAASWQGTVTVVRVAPDGALTELGGLEIDGSIGGVDASVSGILLIAGSEGLTLIDVSDPGSPVVTAVRPCGWASDVAAEGVIAHVAVDTFGVLTFDVGDPGDPYLLSDTPLDGGVRHLQLAAGRLAVSTDTQLHVMDVSVPWQPVLRNTLPIDATHVVMAGDLIHAVWDGTLAVIKLDDSGGGEVIGRLTIEAGEYALMPNGTDLVLVGNHDVEVFDLSEPTSYAPAMMPLGFVPTDLHIDGDRLVTIDVNGRLRVYSIADPRAPEVLGETFLAGPLVELVVDGDWAFVGDDGSEAGLTGVDLSDPAAPTVAWIMPLARLHRNLALSGDRLVVLCAANQGLYVVDVADPAVPVRRGSMAYGGYDVALRGDIAYVAANLDGLAVIDISLPDAPQLVRTVPTTGLPRSVAVSGDLMVTVDYNYGLSTLSLADPYWPELVGAANAPRGAEGGVVLLDDHAYIASWWMGFLAYDVSDPQTPTLTGSVHGTRSRIVADAGVLYAPTLAGNVLVLPPQCGDPTTVDHDRHDMISGPLRVLDVAPNPCNPATEIRCDLAAAGPVHARVYDLRGRRVADLAGGWHEAGELRMRWNGRDRGGRTVAAGTYLIRIEAGPAAVTARVSLVD